VRKLKKSVQHSVEWMNFERFQNIFQNIFKHLDDINLYAMNVMIRSNQTRVTNDESINQHVTQQQNIQK